MHYTQLTAMAQAQTRRREDARVPHGAGPRRASPSLTTRLRRALRPALIAPSPLRLRAECAPGDRPRQGS